MLDAEHRDHEQPSQRRSATDRTIDQIAELISSGELQPCQRLPTESEFATRMGVSRSSLREAVRVLAFLGILETRVGDGSYVTDLDGASLLGGMQLLDRVANDKTYLEIIQIRRIIESAAAGIAATMITEEGIAHLEDLIEKMKAATSEAEFVSLDQEFHDGIAAATGNKTLEMLCNSCSTKTQRARIFRGTNIEGIHNRSVAEHDDIFRYIKQGDATLASAAAASHVARAESWLSDAIRDNKEKDA